MPSSSRQEGVWPSSPNKERVMAMVIFFLSSVESCEGGHGISSKEEAVCHSSPKKARVRPRSSCNLKDAKKTRKAGPRWPWPGTSSSRSSSSSSPQSRAVEVVKAYLLEKRGSALLVLRRRG